MTRKTISQDQLDGFSIDEETSQLYWRNREIVTVISLPWWVQVSVLAAGFGSVIGAIAAVAALFIK